MKEIAIDGPAGAGKSTVAKMVARELGYNYLDTGAMYRAAAYFMLQRGAQPADVVAVKAMLLTLDMRIEYDAGGQRVLLDGVDVMPHIRTPEISRGASDIAVIPEVRVKLVEIQRGVSQKYDVVMDGRDIGTYVLPNADYKFYLTANVATRAKRRWLEMREQGVSADLRQIEEEIAARDKTDASREFAPLKVAEGAILVDTTSLTAQQVAAQVIHIITGDK